VKKFIAVAARIVEWASLALLGWIGYCLDFDLAPLDNDELLRHLVGWSQSHAARLVLALAALVAVMRVLRWTVRPESKEEVIIERLVTDALDKFREVCFPDLQENTPVDHNRVTIFKHVSMKWWISPFKSFLNPWGWWRFPWSAG